MRDVDAIQRDEKETIRGAKEMRKACDFFSSPLSYSELVESFIIVRVAYYTAVVLALGRQMCGRPLRLFIM